jgi:phosphoribosylformimino-5-aminoimidazole carboxamide ribotide isomerase
MELYPAIDIRGGKCVRLRQGDYADETVYGDDPVAVAYSFAVAGARWIHCVDLDAARTGDGANRSIVGRIAEEVRALNVRVQTGGGVRTEADVRRLIDMGVGRVVVGTRAVEDPDFVAGMANQFPEQVAVGLDARALPDGTYEVAAHGWTAGTGVELFGLLSRFATSGVAAAIITEIGRDGMLTGPDLLGLGRALDESAIEIVASGGVSSLADLVALRLLKSGLDGRSLVGAIAGKAIYEGRFTVEEGIAACRNIAETSVPTSKGE